MAKELKANKWYYIMLGFGGSESTYIAPFEKTGAMSSGCISCFTMFKGSMEPDPILPIWRGITIDGRIMELDPNELDMPGIGGLKEAFDFYPYMTEPDMNALSARGYNEMDISDEFRVIGHEDGDPEDLGDGENDLNPKRLAMLKDLGGIHEEQEREAERKAAQDLADERARLREEYAFLPHNTQAGHYVTTAEVAANLRCLLKARFPGVKFAVRKSHTGSIRVEYTDGPATREVERLVDMFQDHHSDAETGDYWDYDPSAFNKEFGGVDCTITTRNYSEGVMDALRRLVDEKYAGYKWSTPEDRANRAWRIFNTTTFPKGAEISHLVDVEDCEIGYAVAFNETA